MKRRATTKGNRYVIFVMGVVIALLVGLALVLIYNMQHMAEQGAVSSRDGVVALKTYRNERLGFSFAYPAKASAPVECVKGTEGGYTSKDKLVDMTVLESADGSYFTVAQAGSTAMLGELTDNGSAATCEMKEVTDTLIATKREGDVGSIPHLTWFVARAASLEDVKKLAPKAYLAAARDVATQQPNLEVSLGKLDGYYRQPVTVQDVSSRVGGGAYQAWYYPHAKLFAYISRGNGSHLIADDRVLDNFVVNNFGIDSSSPSN